VDDGWESSLGDQREWAQRRESVGKIAGADNIFEWWGGEAGG